VLDVGTDEVHLALRTQPGADHAMPDEESTGSEGLPVRVVQVWSAPRFPDS